MHCLSLVDDIFTIKRYKLNDYKGLNRIEFVVDGSDSICPRIIDGDVWIQSFGHELERLPSPEIVNT